MIAHIRGRLIQKNPTVAVIETSGVGFHILIPVSTFETLGNPNEEVILLTHLHVREDVLQLFGFATQDERELFLQLISVNGVGPKLAIGILSGIKTENFRQAVREGNAAVLDKIPGVGKKTAERLLVELRDKIGLAIPSATTPALGPIQEQAILALVSLGYKRAHAEEAIQKILRQESELSLEALLRTALSQMNR